LRASADELKLQTDKISQEHYVAGREMAEHAQALTEFIEQQRKSRSKVMDAVCVPVIMFSGLLLSATALI